MNISGARLHLSARGMPRGGKERKRKTSSAVAAAIATATASAASAAAAASAGAAWLLLCIGEPCPGELSTRNDPRESKKMQTPSPPMDFHLFLLSLRLFFSFAIGDDESNFRIPIDCLWISGNQVFISTCPSSRAHHLLRRCWGRKGWRRLKKISYSVVVILVKMLIFVNLTINDYDS